MLLLLSRLNDSQLSENSSMSNSDEEEEFDDFDDSKELNDIDDKNLKLIQKIYDELFEDHACIINFLKMLNVSKVIFYEFLSCEHFVSNFTYFYYFSLSKFIDEFCKFYMKTLKLCLCLFKKTIKLKQFVNPNRKYRTMTTQTQSTRS